MSVKIGPGRKREFRLLHIKNIRSGNVGRHQIGRKLDTRKLRADYSRQRFDRQSLRRSGNAFQQRVSFGENGDENLLDNFVLPDDNFAEFILNMFDGCWCIS